MPPEVRRAATYSKSAKSAYRTPEELLTAAANFEAVYVSWLERKALLKTAREAVALVVSPPSYPVPSGGNLLYDGLLEQLERADSEARRLQVLSLAQERLAEASESCDHAHTAALWFAILADFHDEQKLWEPWQAKYNRLIAQAEQTLADARASFESDSVADLQAKIGFSLALRPTFSPHTTKRLPLWEGDAASGFSLGSD